MVLVGRQSQSSQTGGTSDLPPVTSKAKDYTERPDEVMEELDELRTRGIAKVLNKHFTDTTKQLAKEKAQADVALADLERRRAQTKEFVPSNNGELNPYDKLYMQLQQKRTECRRKEKETLLLYQRYVMKYGKSAKTLSPMKGKETVLDSKNDPTSATKWTALGTLDENAEINFSKVSQKHAREMENTPKKSGGRSNEPNAKKKQEKVGAKVNHFMSALNKFMTEDKVVRNSSSEETNDCIVSRSKSLDGGLSKAERGAEIPFKEAALGDPTMEQLPPSPAPEVKQFMSVVSNFMASQNGNEEQRPETEINEDVKQAEAGHTLVGFEDGSSSSKIVSAADTNAAVDLNQSDLIMDNAPPATVEPVPIENRPPELELDRGDDVSAKNEYSTNGSNVQMATSSNSLSADGPMPHTPERTMKENPILSTPTACTTPPDDAQNMEAPSFATTTVDEDVDDRSIISGLTSVNSALTRQMLDEIEEEMEDFIKTETEAIRKKLDMEEEELSTSNHESFGNCSSSLLGDESVRVAMKAEAMALEMQRILDEFANEDASVAPTRRGEASDEEDADTVLTKKYPHKFEPAILGEDWYVYYDDNYQREFYVEKKSSRTQWDYPTSVLTPRTMEPRISSDDFLSDIQSVASSTRGGSLIRRSSRRSLYRRQRRKRRTRRLLVSFFTLFSVLVAVFHWRIHYPEKTFSSSMAAALSSIKNITLQDSVTYVKDQFEYAFTDRRQREQEEEKAKIYAKAQRERQAREMAARKARVEAAAKKAKEDSERKAKEEAERQARAMSAREEEARIEAERAAEEEDRKAKSEKHENRRPWGCNIPFAYIVPRCNRLAQTKPMFQEMDFVFLQ